MSINKRNLLSVPGVPSFLENLYVGQFRWDLLEHFPEQGAEDRRLGDNVVDRLGDLFRLCVDPATVEAERRLPRGYIEALRKNGFLRLQVPSELGGLDLSDYNTFRLMTAAASWSVPAALVIALETAVGLGAFLPALPPGPLRDFVCDRIAAGAVSGSADTEPDGAANSVRQTRAVPSQDGLGYLITGRKLHIGNGPIADVLAVTATLDENGMSGARLFFVDTRSPGFRVESQHEFMGVKGFPNAAIVLDDVYVPREHMWIEQRDSECRITPHTTTMVVRGRLHMITAPSLAVARQCLLWSRDFLRRRIIDGRPLGEYEEIQRLVSISLAEVFAIETVAQWCLLGDHRSTNKLLEQNAAKNIGAVTAWRVVDRTMSLLAGEGFETAASKEQRQARPLPLERAFRDARNFRISGGVEFQIDNWTAQMAIFSYYYPEPENAAEIDSIEVDFTPLRTANLTKRNHEHLKFVITEVRRFGQECLRWSRQHPDFHELFERENIVMRIGEIANELLAMALVLARSSHSSASGLNEIQHLADVYCTESRRRLADLWDRIADGGGPDHAAPSRAWLTGEGLEFLSGDTLLKL